jgi:hypothetical protein
MRTARKKPLNYGPVSTIWRPCSRIVSCSRHRQSEVTLYRFCPILDPSSMWVRPWTEKTASTSLPIIALSQIVTWTTAAGNIAIMSSEGRRSPLRQTPRRLQYLLFSETAFYRLLTTGLVCRGKTSIHTVRRFIPYCSVIMAGSLADTLGNTS